LLDKVSFLARSEEESFLILKLHRDSN